MSTLNNGDHAKIQYKLDIVYNGSYYPYIDMYDKNETVVVKVGNSKLLPGINEKLLVINIGDGLEFLLTPDKAFGTYDATKIIDVDKILVSPSGDEIVIGQVYTDKTTHMIGKVIEINNETVKVNFNHPAVDQNVNVKLTIIEKIEN